MEFALTEPVPPTQTLAERAVQRLRKLASGNGMEPASIAIIEVQEQIFEVKGRLEVTPLCEVEQSAYAGAPKNRASKIVGSFADLQQAVASHQREFRENPNWIAAALEEIKANDPTGGQGWGLENAKVTLPQKSGSFAATQTCPTCNGGKTITCAQCNGQGQIICRQCQGVGRELCYYCGGRGEDPQQPGQRCHTCDGTKYALCRFCRGNKYLPCPTCNGRRGTPCIQCNATGRLTQEVVVTCGAETHFKFQAENLPSGLRRGLDRIGIANLGKGHAEIKATRVSKEIQDETKIGAPIPLLDYVVKVPYAEMRMSFGQKKAVVSAVGKRCAINGVPAFLDQALQVPRDKLHEAALGQLPLEQVTDAPGARALKEILALTVAGKGKIEEVRKLYPFGLSGEAIQAILSDMQLSLNKTTLKGRSGGAAICVILSALFFYEWFVSGFGTRMTFGRGTVTTGLYDLLVLIVSLCASWAIVNFATRFMLQRRFPQMSHALQQKIGKTGYTMLGFIVAFYIAMIFFAPVKPIWLPVRLF